MLRLRTQEGGKKLLAGIAEARACRDISLLVGYCILASQEGRAGRYAEAFSLLAEAERLMHIWDVPPVYYLAMITLAKCELWLSQGRSTWPMPGFCVCPRPTAERCRQPRRSFTHRCHCTSNCIGRRWSACKGRVTLRSAACERW